MTVQPSLYIYINFFCVVVPLIKEISCAPVVLKFLLDNNYNVVDNVNNSMMVT